MKAYLIALLAVCITASSFYETHDAVTCPRGSELLDVYAGKLGLPVTYSSHWPGLYFWRLDSPTSWSARYNNGEQWIQIASPIRLKWIGVVTQGRKNANQWVTSYKVFTSDDGTTWEEVDNGKSFDGNNDRNSHERHWFDDPVCARAIRLVPKSWRGHISLRFDFIYAQKG